MQKSVYSSILLPSPRPAIVAIGYAPAATKNGTAFQMLDYELPS